MKVISTSLLALAMAIIFNFSAQSQITVTGSASALKMPAKFKATFAIINIEKSAYKAWKSAEGEAEDIIDDLNLEKQVKSIDLGETNTSQIYNQAKGVYMYKAIKLVVIEVDSLGFFEDLAKDLLKQDVIQLQNVELMPPNMEQTMQNLIGLAIDEAKAKAQAMAKSAGVTLGKAIKIDLVASPNTTTFIRADKLTEYQGLKLNKVHMKAIVQVSFAIDE